MTKMEITRASVTSCGCVLALMSAGGGALGGVLLLLVRALLHQGGISSEGILGMPDWVVLMLAPITGAVIGLLVGCLTAVLYNVAARCVGGLKVEVGEDFHS